MADDTLYRCQNCLKHWKLSELKLEIPHYNERVAPGEPEPAGQCRSAGASVTKFPLCCL